MDAAQGLATLRAAGFRSLPLTNGSHTNSDTQHNLGFRCIFRGMICEFWGFWVDSVGDFASDVPKLVLVSADSVSVDGPVLGYRIFSNSSN